MANNPNLHAMRGKVNEWECSACKEAFSGNKMKVVNDFGAHVRQKHKAPPKPKEDFSEAAFRVVREASDKY
jgi:NAD-dependent SIR2 family protein deacetylase